MIGLAVAVTVVCRRSSDASVRETGVVLLGWRGLSGDRRRGARCLKDGRRERISRGCRSSDIDVADDGWSGGIVPKVWIPGESCELQVPPARRRMLKGRLLSR